MFCGRMLHTSTIRKRILSYIAYHTNEQWFIEIPFPCGASMFPQPMKWIRSRLSPSAVCWTASSELYVGCKEGFLLQVDPESLSITVLFSPTGTSKTKGNNVKKKENGYTVQL